MAAEHFQATSQLRLYFRYSQRFELALACMWCAYVEWRVPCVCGRTVWNTRAGRPCYFFYSRPFAACPAIAFGDGGFISGLNPSLKFYKKTLAILFPLWLYACGLAIGKGVEWVQSRFVAAPKTDARFHVLMGFILRSSADFAVGYMGRKKKHEKKLPCNRDRCSKYKS